jgi:hypothetical protein
MIEQCRGRKISECRILETLGEPAHSHRSPHH